MGLENLQERMTLTATRVDRNVHVIRDVKILGLVSANGREYPLRTIERAASKYEGAKVNVNHPKGRADEPRRYQERLGVLRGVRVKPTGLYGNLHYNPAHEVAAMLEYDAEHSPESVGLSHNVQARTTRQGGKTVVEEIVRVQSVDLVGDPATVSGLYESVEVQEVKQPSRDIFGRLVITKEDMKDFVRAISR